MSVKFPLATSSWDESERNALIGVIDSNHFSMGEKVFACEKQFADFFGSKYAVMVNSGSSANLVMVSALMYRKSNRLKPGDKVVVPAVSWSTTYYPLSQCGLELVFVDIDKETLNFDLNALAEVINRCDIKLIMCVNLLGNPNDFSAIQSIAANNNIELIEDNCESMGAKYCGTFAGTFGLAGSFSSFFSHHISTMEGGFVVTDDEELYQIMLSLRAHGWTRNLPKENLVCIKSSDQFEESFRFVLPGFNLRPLEMSGALGIEQLKKLPAIIEGRRRNAANFLSILSNIDYLFPQKEIGESSWFGFSITISEDAPVKRRELLNRFGNAGFEVRPVVAGNFAKQDVMKYLNHCIPLPLSNADYIDENSFFIGNHHYPMNDALDALSQIL